MYLAIIMASYAVRVVSSNFVGQIIWQARQGDGAEVEPWEIMAILHSE